MILLRSARWQKSDLGIASRIKLTLFVLVEECLIRMLLYYTIIYFRVNLVTHIFIKSYQLNLLEMLVIRFTRLYYQRLRTFLFKQNKSFMLILSNNKMENK